MSEEALEETTPNPEVPTTGSLAAIKTRSFWGKWLVLALVVSLGVLLVGDVVLYSLYKAMEAKVDHQEYRLDRLDTQITNTLISQDTAIKMASLEMQVDEIDVQIGDLRRMVRESLKLPVDPPTPGTD